MGIEREFGHPNNSTLERILASPEGTLTSCMPPMMRAALLVSGSSKRVTSQYAAGTSA